MGKACTSSFLFVCFFMRTHNTALFSQEQFFCLYHFGVRQPPSVRALALLVDGNPGLGSASSGQTCSSTELPGLGVPVPFPTTDMEVMYVQEHPVILLSQRRQIAVIGWRVGRWC